MRTHTIGAGVLLSAIAATLSGPAAFAEPAEGYPPESPEIYIVADESPQPGEDIKVVLRCAGDIGQPTSPALQIGELQRVDVPVGIPTFVAPATIKPDTTPGDYLLLASCAGEQLSSPFVVHPPSSGYLTGEEYPVSGDTIGVVLRCPGKVGQPQSPAVTFGELQPIAPEAGLPTYSATGTVKDGTAPGGYPLTFTCDHETFDIGLTVYEAEPEGGTPQTQSGTQVTSKPASPPQTGTATTTSNVPEPAATTSRPPKTTTDAATSDVPEVDPSETTSAVPGIDTVVGTGVETPDDGIFWLLGALGVGTLVALGILSVARTATNRWRAR